MSKLSINEIFINPSVATNSILYTSPLITDQLHAFGWTSYVTTPTSLQKGITPFA